MMIRDMFYMFFRLILVPFSMVMEGGGGLEQPLLPSQRAPEAAGRRGDDSSSPRQGGSRAGGEDGNGGARGTVVLNPAVGPEPADGDGDQKSAVPQAGSVQNHDGGHMTHLRNAAGGLANWTRNWVNSFTLFPIYMEEERNENEIKRDKCYSLVFLMVAVVIGLLVLCLQLEHRPMVEFTEKTNDPLPPSPALTCGCSIPDQDNGQMSSCYKLKSPAIETVTVVSFPNFTSPDLPNIAYGGDLEEANDPSLQLVYRTIYDSYLVSNTLTELNLWKEDKKMLSPLYDDFKRYFEDMETVDYNIDHILDNTTLFEFPSYFMFMMIQFQCTKYSACSPGVILYYMGNSKLCGSECRFSGSSIGDGNLITNSTDYVGNEWLTCGGYDGNSEWDPVNNFYRGRCMAYPTYPTMSARVKKLLYFLRSKSRNGEIRNLAGYFNTSNVVTFVSRMEQVNQSTVTDNVPMVMGYLEVEPGTAQWLRLADHFPGVRFECSATNGINARGWTEVCNASSICLTYKTAAEVGFSSVKMNCMDFDRYNYTNCVLLANSTGNFDRVDELCNPEANCKCVPSRKVKRQVVSETALNKMNVKAVESEIDTTSKQGVCRNVYTKVVRYHSKSLNRAVFLETNCSQEAGICTITGRYNLLEDEAGATPRTLDDEEVKAAANDSTPFACSGFKRQSLPAWVVPTFGVIVAWMTSMYWVAGMLYSYLFIPVTGHVTGSIPSTESSGGEEDGGQDGNKQTDLEVGGRG